MDKRKLNFDDVKKIAEDAGHIALGLGIMAGEKAKPYADKIGDELKRIVSPSPKKEDAEKGSDGEINDSPKTTEGFDADKVLNSIVEGAYIDQEITDKKGTIYVGEKEISRMNCESYETDIDSDVVDVIKEQFSEYRKHCFNPINRFSSDKYIAILWRNGERSVACVNSSYYDQIVKILS